MRNSSFFEKLTGSLRLSDDDLNELSEQDEQDEKPVKNKKAPTSVKPKEKDEIIEEVDDEDFEIPDDENIETIEEVIEDDTIDEEQVEEYYEEIYEEEEDEDIEDDDEPSNIAIHDEGNENDSSSNEEDDEINDSYPVFKVAHTEEEHEIPNINGSIELPVDVFEMHNEIVLRILVPGITPENLKVSITRDHVSLSCTRPTPEGIKDENYFEREIPYGNFNRMIHLPSDVDVEKAEAVEKYGLLIIRLPMLDAKKVQELKIKSV